MGHNVLKRCGESPVIWDLESYTDPFTSSTPTDSNTTQVIQRSPLKGEGVLERGSILYLIYGIGTSMVLGSPNPEMVVVTSSVDVPISDSRTLNTSIFSTNPSLLSQ